MVFWLLVIILDVSFKSCIGPKDLHWLDCKLLGSFGTTLATYKLMVLFTLALIVPPLIELCRLIGPLFVWNVSDFGIAVAT